MCVDINTGYTDPEPIKERDAESTLKAFKKITSREPLKDAPKYVLQTDGGSEFRGVYRHVPDSMVQPEYRHVKYNQPTRGN